MSGKESDTVIFSPHWTEAIGLNQFVPIILAGSCLLLRNSEEYGMGEMVVAAGAFSVAVLSAFLSERKRRRTNLTVSGSVISFGDGRTEKTLRADGVTCVEISRSPFSAFWGTSKAMIYSDCEKKPWTSVVLAEKNAEKLLACMMNMSVEENGSVSGRVIRGKHSAAMAALTSAYSAPLVLGSAQFALFSGGYGGMIVISFLLLAGALICMLYAMARCHGILLVRRKNGFEVMSGILKKKRAFIPTEALSAVHVSCNPASVILRSGRVSLICRGGREILCLCSVARGAAYDTALRILGAAESPKTSLSDVSSVCRRYVALLTVFSVMSVLVWFYTWNENNEIIRSVFCLSGVFLSAGVLHCVIGMICAPGFRLEVTPSAVCVGGMGICSAEYSFIRRGCLSGFSISRTLLEQANNLCCVIPFVTGKRMSVRCRCIPFGETDGLLGRFC